jgi:hypothetical protein
MKSVFRLLFLSLLVCAAGAIAGCTSKAPKEVFHAGDEVPPDFVTGPAGMFLTNLDGFSATVAFSVASAGGLPHTTTGDLLEREGRFIFQPAGTVETKNALLQGGMIFIWDETMHAGYVLSDPLQAYARITTGVQGTNITWSPDGAAEEAVNGHPCRRVQAVVDCDDGSSERFTVWQAEDEKRVPARIRLTSGSRPFTVDFSNIRLELPKPELFIPPDGFTKYVTSVALMNELILRQTELIKANGPKGPMLDQGGPLIQNWRPTTTQ